MGVRACFAELVWVLQVSHWVALNVIECMKRGLLSSIYAQRAQLIFHISFIQYQQED